MCPLKAYGTIILQEQQVTDKKACMYNAVCSKAASPAQGLPWSVSSERAPVGAGALSILLRTGLQGTRTRVDRGLRLGPPSIAVPHSDLVGSIHSDWKLPHLQPHLGPCCPVLWPTPHGVRSAPLLHTPVWPVRAEQRCGCGDLDSEATVGYPVHDPINYVLKRLGFRCVLGQIKYIIKTNFTDLFLLSM